MSISEVLSLFLNYVTHFGHSSVVFDGYNTLPNIKDQEHMRWSLKLGQVTPNREVNKDMKVIGNQEAFLCNANNKAALINRLSDHLRLHDISVYHAADDADMLIVSVALQCATQSAIPVAVVAEDTDILVLLLHHRKPDMPDIFFVSEAKRGRGSKTIPGKFISVSGLKYYW